MAKDNKPTHTVSFVTGEGEKAFWKKIGAAWEHKDGDGFNVNLEFVPLGQNGRIVLRKIKSKQEDNS